MGFLDFIKRKQEIRADTEPKPEQEGVTGVNDILLRSLITSSEMTKEKALELPTVQACLGIITATITRLPIKLYRKKKDQSVEIVDDDPRVSLLNDDTGDTLTAKMFWRAMLEDYYFGRGAHAYLHKVRTGIRSIHYINDDDFSIAYQSFDPIYKEYIPMVNGRTYRPGDFLTILRKTRDGMVSRSLIEEAPLVLQVAYEEMLFELTNAKKGGTKRGFLESERTLTQKMLDALKEGFRKLYGTSDENIVVLNQGVKFHEASASPAELQLNENKRSNAEDICKLFGIPASMVCGSQTGNSMTDYDISQFIRACVAVMTDIECSLNRDLLSEEEKGTYYWQFDTRELTRGSILERYQAYQIGLDKNFLQIDEVRAMEDMPSLGIEWLQLNLNTVLYKPKTKEIYTPNTNAFVDLENAQAAAPASGAQQQEGGESNESGATS